MRSARGKNAYDHQKFHYSPLFELADIICEGSDEEETPEQTQQKHLRYETSAERCASGKLPVLQSIALRGPLNSDWINPWRHQTTKALREEGSCQFCPDSMLLARENLIESVANYGLDCYASFDPPPWSRSLREDITQYDISPVDTLSSFKETCRTNDIVISQGRCGEKQMSNIFKAPQNFVRKYHNSKREKETQWLNTLRKNNSTVNWDDESFPSCTPISHLTKKGNSKNISTRIEPSERSHCIATRDAGFLAERRHSYSSTDHWSSFSSSSSTKNRYEVNQKENNLRDVRNDYLALNTKNPTNFKNKSSSNSVYAINSIFKSVNKSQSISSRSSDSEKTNNESFVTDYASSRDLERFVFKKKKRKRTESLDDPIEQVKTSQRYSNNFLPRKKIKTRETKENEKEFLQFAMNHCEQSCLDMNCHSEHSKVMPKTRVNWKSSLRAQRSSNSSQNSQNYPTIISNLGLDPSIDLDYPGEKQKNLSESASLASSEGNTSEIQVKSIPRKMKSNKMTFTTDKAHKYSKPLSQHEITQNLLERKEYLESESGQKLPQSNGDLHQENSIAPLPPLETIQEKSTYLTTNSQPLPQTPKDNEIYHQNYSTNGFPEVFDMKSTHKLRTPNSSARHLSSQEHEMSPLLPKAIRSETSIMKIKAIHTPINNQNLALTTKKTADNESYNILSPQSTFKSSNTSDDQNVPETVGIAECKDKGQNENLNFPEVAPNSGFRRIPLTTIINHEIIETSGTSFAEKSNTHGAFESGLESNLTEKPAIGTPDILSSSNLKNDDCNKITGKMSTSRCRSQSSFLQNPWAEEIQPDSSIYHVARDPYNLPASQEREEKSAISTSCAQKIAGTSLINETREDQEKYVALTPEDRKISLSDLNHIETPHMNHLTDTQELLESAMRNPWRSIIKNPSSAKSTKRVSFKYLSENEPDDLQKGQHPSPLHVNSQDSEQNSSLAAMADAFIAADRQVAREQSMITPTLSENNLLMSRSPQPTMDQICDHEKVKDDSDNETSWLDSSFLSNSQVEISKTPESDVDEILGDIGNFLEDWSVETELKKIK
ncbi:hypothetical protein GcM3_215009 [Golovinomyces cichoracearum]|uniref:Uncharacterized protein n=1 Tax=Golovinomyces cichoracearum TaxID=62708 RepID=A0A420H8S3_9PEZI|nr:hypothetical protein GcM3_215009 [Golovinomyces cichoracearum]